MMAGESTLLAHRRWSRLAKRCTCVQASGPSWRPLSRPVRGFWCQVCPLWCLAAEMNAGGGRRGRAWCSDACLHGVCDCVCTFQAHERHPVVVPRAPHCVRQASKSTLVCGVGGGATALADTDLKNPVELVGWLVELSTEGE